jgi:phosphatidylglycerol:prolipoprotein diacylglycerol transferase
MALRARACILSLSMYPFLNLGSHQIPTFGLMVAFAMLAAFFLLRADFARRGLTGTSDSNAAELFVAIPCVCGIIGARLYHVLESPQELLANPWGELFSRYGLAWFGGLIGGALAWIILARWQKIPLLKSLDAGSPAAALGYGVGRLGCLLAGDGDYGVPTSLPWGMSFPNGLVPTDQHVHPTPIYELLAALLIAWILWRIGARQISTTGGKGPGSLPAGAVFAFYLLLTGLSRFLVEFIRINPRSFLGMTNAQVASLASILVGGFLFWKLRSGERADQGGG